MERTFEKVFREEEDQQAVEDLVELGEYANGEAIPDVMRGEIELYLNSLSNNKAPGVDGVPKELLVAGGEAVIQWLEELCQGAIGGRGIVRDWSRMEIIPFHKKGDAAECANYRPISLLPHAYKVFAKLIQNRMKQREEEILGEEQAGFRSGRGTVDHIFTLLQVIEKRWEKNKDTYCVFIDFKQAFDSINREYMIRVMRGCGFQEELLNTLEELYRNTTARVRKADIVTENFETTRGVIQGCPLSPHLFNLYLERVMLEALEGEEAGVEIVGIRINYLRYADDIVVIAETVEDLQRMVGRIEEQCRRYRLIINRNKTKSLKIGREITNMYICFNTGEVEQDNSFK